MSLATLLNPSVTRRTYFASGRYRGGSSANLPLFDASIERSDVFDQATRKIEASRTSKREMVLTYVIVNYSVMRISDAGSSSNNCNCSRPLNLVLKQENYGPPLHRQINTFLEVFQYGFLIHSEQLVDT